MRVQVASTVRPAAFRSKVSGTSLTLASSQARCAPSPSRRTPPTGLAAALSVARSRCDHMAAPAVHAEQVSRCPARPPADNQGSNAGPKINLELRPQPVSPAPDSTWSEHAQKVVSGPRSAMRSRPRHRREPPLPSRTLASAAARLQATSLGGADGALHDGSDAVQPATSRSTRSSTAAPAAASLSVMLSRSLWLMPSLQGTKIIWLRQNGAIRMASCPARLRNRIVP